jgi:hypothetical protein
MTCSSALESASATPCPLIAGNAKTATAPRKQLVKNRLHLDVRVGTGLVGEDAWPRLRPNAHDWSRSARYACDYCLPMATTSRAS